MSKKSYKPLTVFCVRCKQEMTCPSNAAIIQCTECSMIQDPFCEYDVKCNDCNHTLTHPITARIIQCPLCSTFMDVSDPNLSTMELVQHKSKKRKLNDTGNDTETDSNTTVSSSNSNYGNSPNLKRRKIGSMRMYNEQWLEYESKQIYRFRPNRPNSNVMMNVNKHINSNTQQSKSDFSKYKKKKKKKNKNNSKYGSFDMTPITFI